jgi:phosphatidylserine/phosphatidylglycerophosphate/cardiolipin synthase-like enzyme
MKKPLHAKVMMKDKKSAFVWSFNYTQNSLENNREVWLFISGEMVKSISEAFESDWKLSEVALR